MADRKSSFFTSLPGILTGLAGLVTAGAAVAAIVVGGGERRSEPDPGEPKSAKPATIVQTSNRTDPPKREDGYTLADWARDANAICEIIYDDIRALGLADDPEAIWEAIPELTRISAHGNAKIGALERPAEAADKIAESLEQASIAETAANNAYVAFNAGDVAAAEQQWAISQQASQSGQALDSELGANVCARGP